MMAGIRYTPEDTELVTLQALLNDLFTRLDMAGALFSQFPILQYVAPERSGYTEFVTIHQRLWKFFRNEIDKHMESYDPDEMRDFMDVYIKMVKSAGPGSSFSGESSCAVPWTQWVLSGTRAQREIGRRNDVGTIWKHKRPSHETETTLRCRVVHDLSKQYLEIFRKEGLK